MKQLNTKNVVHNNTSTVSLPYKNKVININIPNHVKLDIIKPKKLEATINWQEKTKVILSSEQWKIFINNFKFKSVLIIINDATRATPSPAILDIILPIFNKYQIGVKIIVATGSHRELTAEEQSALLKNHFDQLKNDIIIHNAYDRNQLQYLEKTSFGTPVWVNKIVMDKKIGGILCINSIEPHYFAGWTGGRKSIMPGIAGIDTITATHRHALESTSKPCKLEGNPVHDDLQECFNILEKAANKPIQSFQFIIDSNKVIHNIVFGHPTNALKEGVKIASLIFQILIQYKYDLVIGIVLPPLDQSLYQAHKGLELGKLALKNQCDFLLWAACEDGVGPDSFLKPLEEIGLINPKKMLQKMKTNYKLGYHKAAKMVENASNFKLWLFSDLNEDIVKNALFNPVRNPQNWLDSIFNTKKIEHILVLYDAGVVVPILTNSERSPLPSSGG